jgi:hypothetical protein
MAARTALAHSSIRLITRSNKVASGLIALCAEYHEAPGWLQRQRSLVRKHSARRVMGLGRVKTHESEELME